MLDRILLCLTVDHYAGAWQGCNTSEDPCHRKLQGCDELEAHSHHKGGCCNWTVKYYSVIDEHRKRIRESLVMKHWSTMRQTGEHHGVSEGHCNEIAEHYGMARKHHGDETR